MTDRAEPRDVFVLGAHDFHQQHLATVETNDPGLRLHRLLTYRELRKARAVDIVELLSRAERQLTASDVEPDGIATYWDFPSSSMVPILCERRGLPTAGLAATLRCEHKYWSRRLQAEVAPEDTPAFRAVDPRDDDAADRVDLETPYWLKPVKSYSSHLSFRIDGDEELEHALQEMDRRIDRIGRPFQWTLDQLDGLPADVAAVGGTHAIAEETIDGQQCTVEGHAIDGEVHVHGVFDIHRKGNSSSFSHYRYPSRLPEGAVERMHAISAAVLDRSGYHTGAWNIEFFHDPEADRTWILEVNPRISQEHTDLTAWVDGTSNLEVMVSAALGRAPRLTPGAGEHGVAVKRFLRTTEDGTVTRVPAAAELADIETRFAPCRVSVEVHEGDRLSELEEQESYSYELAYVYLAGEDDEELTRRFHDVAEALPLEVRG